MINTNVPPAEGAKVVRNFAQERERAMKSQATKLGDLCVDRQTGKLGDDVIKLAQAVMLCTLPYSSTDSTKIERRARLGEGDYLYVTFTAGIRGEQLPFGADRKLLAWILDRAIQSNSPYIPWRSAYEFQKEIGQKKSGKNNRDLMQRFRRISGLVINIQRRNSGTKADMLYKVIESSYLPESITGKPDQNVLPALEDGFGIRLDPSLFSDIKDHNLTLPRKLWMYDCGPMRVHDMVLWLCWRCHAAMSESVIPWDSLADQFDQDANPRRMKQHARKAITIIRTLWPSAVIQEIEAGILVDKASQPLLADDTSRNRVRRA